MSTIKRLELVAAIEQCRAVKSAAAELPGKSLTATLNKLLTGEFIAIHEYTGHYAVTKNLGYNKLAAGIKERLDDELKHANMLTYRIVFLGGDPTVDGKIDAEVGKTVPKQFELDKAKELGAVQDYNDAIQQAIKAGDAVTRAMLESIVKDEDDHVDEISTAQDQITQMGIGQYLVTQV